MMRSPISPWHSLALGAGVGGALAAALHLWTLYATHVAGMAAEGVAFWTMIASSLLAAPFILLLQPGLDALPAGSEYPGMLMGIVINWSLLSWLRGRFRRHRAIA